MTSADFYMQLHELACEIAERLSDEGDEGLAPVGIHYEGTVGSNYPWLYLSFFVDGQLTLKQLNWAERHVQLFCYENGGTLDGIKIWSHHGRLRFTITVIRTERS